MARTISRGRAHPLRARRRRGEKTRMVVKGGRGAIAVHEGKVELGRVWTGPPPQRAKMVATVAPILDQAATAVVVRARAKAPKDTGGLSGAITKGPVVFQKRNNSAFVKVGVFAQTLVQYARFLEWGTGPAGRASLGAQPQSGLEKMKEYGYAHGPVGGWPPLDRILAWMGRKGIQQSRRIAFAIQMKIRREGTRAQPFLFPAFEEVRAEVIAKFRVSLQSIMARP